MQDSTSDQETSELLRQFESSGAAEIAEEYGLDFVDDGDQIVLLEDSELDPLKDDKRDALQAELKEVSGVDVAFGLL